MKRNLKILAERGNVFFRVDNCNKFFALLHDDDFYWKYSEKENFYIFILGKNCDKAIYAKAENINLIDVDAGRLEIVL